MWVSETQKPHFLPELNPGSALEMPLALPPPIPTVRDTLPPSSMTELLPVSHHRLPPCLFRPQIFPRAGCYWNKMSPGCPSRLHSSGNVQLRTCPLLQPYTTSKETKRHTSHCFAALWAHSNLPSAHSPSYSCCFPLAGKARTWNTRCMLTLFPLPVRVLRNSSSNSTLLSIIRATVSQLMVGDKWSSGLHSNYSDPAAYLQTYSDYLFGSEMHNCNRHPQQVAESMRDYLICPMRAMAANGSPRHVPPHQIGAHSNRKPNHRN